MKKILLSLILRFIKRNSETIFTGVSRLVQIATLQKQNLSSSELIVANCPNNIIVSLTSFGNRINEVYLAIESICNQTLKPEKVILWLDKNEFSIDTIPVSLKLLRERGLIIEFCDDFKSYNKLLHSLKQYPSYYIITIDDDIIYRRDLIEILFKFSALNKDVIISTYCRYITVKGNGELSSYRNWALNTDETLNPSFKNFALGYGGVLYPPNCFNSDVFNIDLIKKHCPYADDIWFKFMSNLSNKKVMSVFDKFDKTSSNEIIFSQQGDSLSQLNVVQNKNDEQIINLQKQLDVNILLP